MPSSSTVEDLCPEETAEWLESLESVIHHASPERARFLLRRLADSLISRGGESPYSAVTPYRNTILPEAEALFPGDVYMERKIRSIIRWNALAMVVRSNMDDNDLGGHISSFSSSATLYDVGFNHFFRAPSEGHLGDLIYYQGHSSPGIYARSFLEGRFEESHLDHFRRESVRGQGLSSYPHPWLMPDYWQFPTVSMGLGPIQAIYQAHVIKYLDARNLVPMSDRKVWAFLGDGECDEPESLGAISLAGRERLDNLVFVVNCNLQRLDGPVRGNGKIIQELEGVFRGAGWNVIKVVWGRLWDTLLARDHKGLLQHQMDVTVDGEYQNCKARGGAYTREHFFGANEELKAMVADLSDEEIMQLNRGGHDPYKVYAAYAAACACKDKPTVILAKTIKGYGLGSAVEAENVTHSVKKLSGEALRRFRDRFDIPLTDEELENVPYYRPPPDSPEIQYMKKSREALGGSLPQRFSQAPPLPLIPASTLKQFSAGLDRRVSTTMAFVRMLSTLVRDAEIGPRVVPIVPDEARTFGMEGMFRQLGIYSSEGQLYEPVDSRQITAYRESKDGQVLEEGISEAGAFSAWLAAATSYSTNRYTLIPFYVFYSMFGFQRVGDLAWAAGDSQARGFLIGATSGRTTLNGEGLQHQDGHSHILADTIPNCISYDPAYAGELAVILRHGLKRMYSDCESVFFYITLTNENMTHPPLPEGAEEGVVKGIYCLERDFTEPSDPLSVQLLGSGAILSEARAAAKLLREEYGCAVNVWSVTSFSELKREALDCERWNMLHPDQEPKVPWVALKLGSAETVKVAVSDYLKSHAGSVASFVPGGLKVLGTDGFGRSDTRQALRQFFEIDRYYITVSALHGLMLKQRIPAGKVMAALKKFEINPEKLNARFA